jgi:serine/threonine protein kinase
MEFNQSLFELEKTTPSLRDHLIITLSNPKIGTLSKLNNNNNKQMIKKCKDFEGKNENVTYLFLSMPNGGERLDSFLNSLFEYNSNNSNNSNNLDVCKKQNDNLINDKSKLIIQKALDSLKVLHQLNKYHGDSHLGNFLVEDDSNNDKIKVRLIDFGFSGSIDENKNTNKLNEIKNKSIAIKNRIANISLILAGFTLKLDKESLTKKISEFDSKLITDPYIEYKLDLIQFLNSLTVVIKKNVYGNTGQIPSISNELFLQLLTNPITNPISYDFEQYEKSILDYLKSLYCQSDL